jgi:Zn-dependent protease with chaperone function
MADAALIPTPKRVLLKGIDPVAFQHPLDRQATDQMKKIKGFDTFMSKFIEYGFERIEYVLNIASSVRVGARQLPKLYEMLQEACAVLDVPEPELYVSSQGGVNAFTSGANSPYIVLGGGLIDLMDDDEVMAVIAHELGHIKCRHVLYKCMARWIEAVAEVIGDASFGIGGLLVLPIEIGLLTWDRRSELSADRASLLAVQEARPCINMLMKLAGGTTRLAGQLDPEEFLTQVRSYGDDMDKSTTDRVYRFLASMSKGTHPFAIERAKQLNDWIDSPEFEQILAGNYKHEAQPVTDGRCSKCGTFVQPGFVFCAGCGERIAW